MSGDDLPTRASLLGRLHDPHDDQAWGEFFRRYEPLIRRWAGGRGLQRADVDEVTSEVLVKLVCQMPTFEYNPQQRFRNWLRTVVCHAICDFARRRQRRPAVPATDLLDHLADPGVEDLVELLNDELEQADDRLRQAEQRVRAAVLPQTWSAFVLTALEGVPTAEVAGRLGLSLGAVYSAHHRVTHMLREQLNGG
jgi:RNA polymerase sigma-70 factor (ECF subfamily)